MNIQIVCHLQHQYYPDLTGNLSRLMVTKFANCHFIVTFMVTDLILVKDSRKKILTASPYITLAIKIDTKLTKSRIFMLLYIPHFTGPPASGFGSTTSLPPQNPAGFASPAK